MRRGKDMYKNMCKNFPLWCKKEKSGEVLGKGKTSKHQIHGLLFDDCLNNHYNIHVNQTNEGVARMNLDQWFEKAMTVETYIASMETNQKELESIYRQFEIQDDESFFRRLSDEKLRVIVLTEDWCGDAMVNVPVLLKLAEKAKMEVRMLLRDQNVELMDQYLTNGTSRAIPIFIFIDQEGEERAVWGPRAASLQKYVDEERAKLPSKDDPNFQEEQEKLYKQMTERYSTDARVWNDIYQSIKECLA